MSDYSQPDFYRFSEDSLRLVDHALSFQDLSPKSVADFGCGCGVIGIEYARRKNPDKVIFLEAQSEFLPHLEMNTEAFLPKATSSEIIHRRFSEVNWNRMDLDLILCNPPFYLPGQGEVSKDQRRHRCRTFEMDSWEILLKLAKISLAPKGLALFVLPNESKLLNKVFFLAENLGLLLEKYVDENLLLLKRETE